MGLKREEGYAEQWKQTPAVTDAAVTPIDHNKDREEEAVYENI